MPQLTFRGIPPEKLGAIAVPLAAQLAAICECGTDNFTFDCLPVTTVSVDDGSVGSPTYPFVEVAWFERGTDVRNRFALAVTNCLQSAGLPEVEVAFKVYAEEAYYVNGKPCS